eukprot:TRINITY_DN37804_c0_g1_i1.p1 TRINITY_DN37804_c0_g1~~TRINITY_DN37804_c0_g1_i1.p1  ORF type:complete len:1351 (-),score=287.90 TRINITY_DN37804_c0_g1_i1:350-4306(-)
MEPAFRTPFLCVEPLLRRGFRRPLQAEDSLRPPEWISPGNVSRIFHDAWAAENKKVEDAVGGKLRKRPRVSDVLLRLYGGKAIQLMVLQMVSVSCRFAAALVLRQLTAHIIDGGSTRDGLTLALMLALLSLVEGVFATNAHIRCHVLALAIFNTFASAVLHKALKLHPRVSEHFPRGSMVSLALSDCNRLLESAQNIPGGAAVPFMVVLAQVIGCALIGPTFIVSLLAVLLIMFAMTQIGKFQGVSFRKKSTAQGFRLSLVNEMLQSMRLTKYYALEDHFQSSIEARREAEEAALRRMKASIAINWSVSLFLPFTATVSILVTHQLVHGELPSIPDTIAMLALIRMMSVPFAFFGIFLGNMTMLQASCQRLEQLLVQPEIQRRVLLPPPLEHKSDGLDLQEQHAVSSPCASFTWTTPQAAALRDFALDVPQGKLVVLVGEMGAGKSSVLSAILGDMEELPTSAPAKVRAESLAYCSQLPMVVNATLRENVLFGCPWNENRYQRALESAALLEDLAVFPSGDHTEIGEKGLTLSGGQKARVALARAVYAATGVEKPRTSLLLLDDPLSAVDAHVGAHLWDRCICGVLAGTTRLLVTNQLQFLTHPDVHEIVVMDQGVIVERGTHGELTACPDGRYKQMLESVEAKVRNADPQKKAPLQKAQKAAECKVGAHRVTVDENKEEGAVTWSTLRFYYKCMGSWRMVFYIYFCAWLYHVGEILPDYYLAFWREGYALFGEDGAGERLPTWAAVGLFGVLLGINARFTWAAGALRVASSVHEQLLAKLLRFPMSFFDSTPSGRVLNRLGEDQMHCDWTVSLQMEVTSLVCAMAFNTLAMVIFVAPPLAFGLLLLIPALVAMREVHRRSAREAVRFWMLTKSPLFHVVEETLVGVSTVAAFGKVSHFVNRFEDALLTNSSWCFTMDILNQWAEQRLQLVGAATVGTLASFIAIRPDVAPAAVSSVALIYALQLAQYLRWCAFFMVRSESSLASVERVAEYVERVPLEAARSCAGDEQLVAAGWPGEHPEIVFDNVSLRYRPHLPLVLRGLSAHVAAREKIGVVGRTGSGKSTLLSCLFRVVELEGGRILIGGHDIASVGLGCLRQRITTVPQDPLLFSGTLRENLDPTGQHSEAELSDGLARCGLSELLARLDGGLEAQVSAQGSNFSIGERQVLCLARALLRGTRLLCLDEATANIDPENDARIQRAIRKEFSDSTVLTIAHRLHTIMDSDRIMVMDTGELMQFDAPRKLLESPGVFQSMCQEAGIVVPPPTSSEDNVVASSTKKDVEDNLQAQDADIANCADADPLLNANCAAAVMPAKQLLHL